MDALNLPSAERLAAAIRCGRAALNWSQQDLARKAGLSLPTVARIEAELTNPRLETVVRLANAMASAGVRFDWSNPQQAFLMSVNSVHRASRPPSRSFSSSSASVGMA